MFWKDVAIPVPSVRALGSRGMDFTRLCEKTSAGYDSLLKLHPQSVKTRMEYGKFLLEVRHTQAGTMTDASLPLPPPPLT